MFYHTCSWHSCPHLVGDNAPLEGHQGLHPSRPSDNWSRNGRSEEEKI